MAASAVSLALLALIPGCGGSEAGAGPRPVRLALDFQPNAAHAGIYAARREGLDRRRGVALRIRVPSASTDSLKLLSAGRADIAVVDIHDLGLARERGSDVVAVAALVQRPLAAVVARRGVRRPRELEGRRVGVTGLPSDDAVLRAVLKRDGGRLARVRRTTIGFSAVPSLIAGRVDAVVTFWNAEGVALRSRGVRVREFRLDGFGAPRYPELVLVVARETLERRRGLVADAVSALAAGTRSALAGRGAAVADIEKASGADRALVRAQLDAVAPALSRSLRLDLAALRGWARFAVRYGILRRRPNIEQAFEPLAR